MRIRALAAVGAAAAGLALAAAPALTAAASAAPPPVTVSVNGDTSGASYDVTAVSKGTVNLAANGNNLPCTASTLGGVIHTGVNATGDGVADVNAASFTGCTFAGFPAAVTTSFPPNWEFNVTNVAGPHEIDGTLTDVSAHVVISGPLGACSFDVTGSVSGFLDPQFAKDDGSLAQQLTVNDSELTISNVDNALTCVGLVNDGDPATFTGSYNVTTLDSSGNPIPGTPISITN